MKKPKSTGDRLLTAFLVLTGVSLAGMYFATDVDFGEWFSGKPVAGEVVKLTDDGLLKMKQSGEEVWAVYMRPG